MHFKQVGLPAYWSSALSLDRTSYLLVIPTRTSWPANTQVDTETRFHGFVEIEWIGLD
jgi:hypothetical protein